MSIFADFMTMLSVVGPAGMLLGLLVVIFFDSMVIPVGPELLAIAIFSTNVDPVWGLLILIVVASGQVLGSSILYLVGRHPRIMPQYLKKVMNRYRSGLIIKDERMVFLNCFVPALPFLGAFVAVANWDYRKSMAYVAFGGVVKYSIFLALSGTFHQLFEQGIAQRISIMAVLALLVASGLYGYSRRRLIFGAQEEQVKARAVLQREE